MTSIICYICQTKCYFYQQNIEMIKSKHTKRPVIELIRMLGRKVQSIESIEITLSEESTSLCYECLDKIDVYDLAKSTVEGIESEMHRYLSRDNLTVRRTYDRIKVNQRETRRRIKEEHEEQLEIPTFDSDSVKDDSIQNADDDLAEEDFTQDEESQDDSDDDAVEDVISGVEDSTECKVNHKETYVICICLTFPMFLDHEARAEIPM